MDSDERGVLTLDWEDWILRKTVDAANGTLGYIRDSSNIIQSGETPVFSWSAFFVDAGEATTNTFSVGSNLAMLTQEILKTGGGIAFALQSALTVAASTTYYEHARFFDNSLQINQTPFISGADTRWFE